jgi:hypothetical protein
VSGVCGVCTTKYCVDAIRKVQQPNDSNKKSYGGTAETARQKLLRSLNGNYSEQISPGRTTQAEQPRQRAEQPKQSSSVIAVQAELSRQRAEQV